ncbi:MAG: carbon storage regulator [Succinivibrio sp.]
MLVISQKNGDTLKIDGGITIRVLDVKGGRVRLGIDAPKSVRVERLTTDNKAKKSDIKPEHDK